MDRNWMYNMLDPSRRLKQKFIVGVIEFVSKAMDEPSFILDGGIRCLCVNCKCQKIHKAPYVRAHLLQVGFMPNYNIWVNHGE